MAGVLAAAGLAGCSPFGSNSAFTCQDNTQCNDGTGGKCEANSLCSYTDPSCMPSGQRYGDNSGGNSGRCVGDEQRDDGGMGDGPVNQVCYGATNGLVKPCFPTAPTGPVMLSGTIDTGTSSLCSTTVTQANGFCVIAAETIQIEATVRAVGTKPLVLVATKTIDVGSTLEAASRRSGAAPYVNTQTGAGSDPTGGCDGGTNPAVNGGGAGGSFIGAGGIGGAGTGGTGGAPGTKRTAVNTLRGGCRGQDAPGTGGKGGRGGGAVYLIAETSILIDAAINASGEGGHPGITGSVGAGGGGSGGMIVLDSPMITNNSAVFANGAGGGEGSGNTTPGNPGPEPIDQNAAPGGGGGTTNGGDGGRGSGGGMADGGNGVNDTNSGGAGGGGIGLIRVFRGTLTGAVSPAPS